MNRVLLAFFLGLSSYWAAYLLASALPAREAEPMPLAWLRVLVEHPWRSPLALSLAWLALLPTPPLAQPEPKPYELAEQGGWEEVHPRVKMRACGVPSRGRRPGS